MVGEGCSGCSLLTMDDSRMSVGAPLLTMEDSRMSSGCGLIPEELAEWRGGGHSSCSMPSGGELVASSCDLSRDIPSGAAVQLHNNHCEGHCATRLPPARAGMDFAQNLSSRDIDTTAEQAKQFDNNPGQGGAAQSVKAMAQVQWVQDSTESSSDGVADESATLARAGVPAGSASVVPKKLQVAKGVPKTRGSGSAGGKGGKEASKGVKGAQIDGDGEGEGKLSGMWTAEENNIFFNALAEHKRTFPKIHDRLQHTKTREQVRCYYYRVIKKINQIIAPAGMKLNKTTGGSAEGAGVIEAILAWWNAMRTGGDDDTSASLFKKSANLTHEERQKFIVSIECAGVSTAPSNMIEPQSPTGALDAHSGSAETHYASSAMSCASDPNSPDAALTATQIADDNLTNSLYCTEEMHPSSHSESATLHNSPSVSALASSWTHAQRPLTSTRPPSTSTSSTITSARPSQPRAQATCTTLGQSLASSHESRTRDRPPPQTLLQQHKQQTVPQRATHLATQQATQQAPAIHSHAERHVPASGMSQLTPHKHARVEITSAESPPDAFGHNVNSPASSANYYTSSGACSGNEGTPRLKLKLLPSHPALGQLIERCGFNGQLQLSFKPGGKSMGSIATHLACKWGQAAHDELRYLMPHRIDAAVGLSFLLHSNSNGVGGVTWTALDRLVQASDVYTDLGQPKVFQLSYGLHGLDVGALDTLALKLARYPPRKLSVGAGIGGGYTENASLPQASSDPTQVPHARMSEAEIVGGQQRHKTNLPHTAGLAHTPPLWALPQGRPHLTTPPTLEKAASRISSCAAAAPAAATSATHTTRTLDPHQPHMRLQATCGALASAGVTPRGRSGTGAAVVVKAPGIVNLVDFVPFLHHRSSIGGCEEDEDAVDERQRQYSLESQEALDLSNSLHDETQDGCSMSMREGCSMSIREGCISSMREPIHTTSLLSRPSTNSMANSTAADTRQLQHMHHKSCVGDFPFSPSRDSFPCFSNHCFSNSKGSYHLVGGSVGSCLGEQGLLGHAAANSRDLPILAPEGADSRDGDTRDALCAGESRGILLVTDDCSSMHAMHAMHAMLDNSRPGTGLHGGGETADGLGLMGGALRSDSRHSILTPMQDKCFADSQLERLLPDHTCESGLLGDSSCDAFGLIKRLREEEVPWEPRKRATSLPET